MTTANEFDARARDWDADPMKHARAAAVAEGIRRAVPLTATTRALEYGSGTGLLSFQLQRELGEIVLGDSSRGMLKVAGDRIVEAGVRNMTPLWLDLLAEPPLTADFDLIYSLMTLHHIPDTLLILRRLHACLRPGGHLCVADLDREDGSFHGAGFDGHCGFERPALAALAEEAGFGELRFETVFAVPRGGREYPLFLMSAVRR